ncbi:MAG: sialidase family protein [Limisphaerales bacterium]
MAFLLLISPAATAGIAPSQVQVFRSGTQGYHTFRIPAVVRASNGTLLAFAEGRRNNSGDIGAIDLVLKRSFDNGLTWGPLQFIGGDGTNTFGNPTPIVDVLTGKILLLTSRNAGNVTENEVLAGTVKDRRAFVQESGDNGATWSAAREITSTAKRADWRYYATGPGHGIQLARGAHAGRLIAPCNHSTSHSADWSAGGAHLLLSDDAGATWRIGADDSPNDGRVNPNECSAVELTDGRIYVAARCQEGTVEGHRAFARSSDGGATFDAPFAIAASLVSPVVESSVVRCFAIDQGGQTNRILFSAPGDPSERRQMKVWSSFDETRTWSTAKVIFEGPSAYSDMVKLPGGKAGLLFECGDNTPYERIVFAVFGAAFLDALEPVPSPGKPPRSGP